MVRPPHLGTIAVRHTGFRRLKSRRIKELGRGPNGMDFAICSPRPSLSGRPIPISGR